MIDTHCHLTDPRLGGDLEGVLARSAAEGVDRLLTVATSVADAAACLLVAGRHPNVRCTVGIHPCYGDAATPGDAARVGRLAKSPGVLAVGEIGLDYHHGPADHAHQRRLFAAQLDVARSAGLPVVIHNRDATADTMDVLRDFPCVRCVFHCFTGTPSEAAQVLEKGYLLGFTGIVTFRKSEALREVVRLTPPERLLIETDAPYLSPEPLRKRKVCEPAFVVHTAAAVAAARGVTVDEIDALTTANAERFFRWR